MDWFSLTTDVLAKKRQECPETKKGVFDDFEKVEGRFSPLEAAALSCILELASLQLYIIDVGMCSSSPDCSNIIARQKIMEVINETREEIAEMGTCSTLYDKAKEEAEASRAGKELSKSLAKNQLRIEDLRSQLKGQEFSRQKDENEKLEVIASLKDTIHEEITKNDAKLRYIDRWETARQGQNRMRCQNAELELEGKLEGITNKCNNEIRVHDEICTFLALEEKVLLDELQGWKDNYEKEMKRRTEKIKMLEVRLKEKEILRHSLLELYEERQTEIDSYLNLKEKIRQEEEHRRFINERATKIQAWWRGTMVRRGLGPFKKKKKPGKEKKKKYETAFEHNKKVYKELKEMEEKLKEVGALKTKALTQHEQETSLLISMKQQQETHLSSKEDTSHFNNKKPSLHPQMKPNRLFK